MNAATRRWIPSALKVFDLGSIVVSFGLATFLLVHTDQGASMENFLAPRAKFSNVAIFAFALFLCNGMFSLCGLYQSKRLSNKLAETTDVLKATTLAMLCLALIAAIFSVVMIVPRLHVMAWAAGSIAVVAARVLSQFCGSGSRRHGRNIRYLLVLGTNTRAVEFVRKIEAAPELGYQLLGFVDEQWPGLDEFNANKYKLACNYAGLAEFVRRNVVDEVVFCLPLQSFYKHAECVAALCEHHGIVMRLASDIVGLKASQLRIEELEGDHHVAAYTSLRRGWPMIIKRTVDVVISLTLIILLAPVFLIVAALIKLTSKGPVFFHQERLGLNKRRFLIHKFRTMVPNAEKMMAALENQNEVSGPVFKIKSDPRVTPIGRIMRRTSIDELPQLFNVLKGDMSLVGPRPLPVRDYEGFNQDWQRRRFSIRPGITCLWQVNGRSSISFEQWMKLDLQYIDEWSLWLDLRILARTIPAVMKGVGAV